MLTGTGLNRETRVCLFSALTKLVLFRRFVMISPAVCLLLSGRSHSPFYSESQALTGRKHVQYLPHLSVHWTESTPLYEQEGCWTVTFGCKLGDRPFRFFLEWLEVSIGNLT